MVTKKVPDLCLFRLKSFSLTSWRDKSLERLETCLCFHLKSLPLPKSECIFFLNRCLGLLVSSSHCYNMLIWPTGTTPAQRPTCGLLHWGACLPTCRLLICSKQVWVSLWFTGASLSWLTPQCIFKCTLKGNGIYFQIKFSVSAVMAVPEPCLDSFVFLRVKERQENILVEPETDDQRCIFFPVSLHLLLFKPTGWQCCLLTFST